MQWVPDNLHAREWVIPFVFSLTDLVGEPPLVTAQLGARYKLQEVVDYPHINLPLHKVYKDKLDRYYYISLASNQVIREFLTSNNIPQEHLQTLTNPLYAQRRLCKIPDYKRGKFCVFCLPEKYVHERSSS